MNNHEYVLILFFAQLYPSATAFARLGAIKNIVFLDSLCSGNLQKDPSWEIFILCYRRDHFNFRSANYSHIKSLLVEVMI